MKKSVVIGSVFLLLVGFGMAAHAGMSSPNYQITTDVLAGGGAPMSSTGYRLNGTIGQPSPLMDPDDPPQSANYDCFPGFWYTLEAALVITDCPGDFDTDGDVDGSDLATFAADFGRMDCLDGPLCEGDFNSDGDVDGSDLATFAADFGRMDCLE